MTRSTGTRRAPLVGVVTVGVLVLVIAVVTALALRHQGLALLDVGWRDWVIDHRTGFLTDVMVNASRFGSTPSLILVTAVAVGWLLHGGQRRTALFLVLASLGGLLIAPVLKDIFDRARPAVAEHVVVVASSSYPSGHSVNSMAVLGLLAVLAARRQPGTGRRVLVVAVAAALVALVGFSRVYLGVHYPSDVLGGWLIGAAWVTSCFTLAPLVRGNSTPSDTVDGGS